jgi:prevent-host-death family protein
MKTTAISKLKSSLSEYLLKVKAGQEIIITDRGKPIAKIVPIKRSEIEIPAHLLTLERAGMVRIGKGTLPGGFWSMPRPKDKNGLAIAKLLEERKESR